MNAQQAHPRPEDADDLASLRREVAGLRAEVGRLRASRRRPARGRHLAALAPLALLVALIPLGVFAASFDDLTGGVHDPNIEAIYAAGITKGCVPDVSYCPTDNVTRQEMASFLARAAGLGGNQPVANALTAVNAQTATTATNAVNAQNAVNATSAQNATNAETLGGKAPTDFVSSSGISFLNYTFYPVTTNSPNLTFSYASGPEVAVQSSVAGERQVRLGLDAPSALFGRAFVIERADICYERDGAAAIVATRLRYGRTGVELPLYADTTVRDSDAAGCYTITLPTPQTATSAIFLQLSLDFPAAGDVIKLYSVRLTLTPTPLGP